MSKLVTGDGRTHIESSLMRESLVDPRVVAKTDSESEFAIMPDVVLVGLGGQSIFDRGKAAVMPLVEELQALREARKVATAIPRARGEKPKGPPPMVLGVGGGTRVRHTVSVALDLGIPTGGVAQLVGAMEEANAVFLNALLAKHGSIVMQREHFWELPLYLESGMLPIVISIPPYHFWEPPPEDGPLPTHGSDFGLFIHAEVLGMKKLIFVKDEDGLFDKDPKKHADAKHIPRTTLDEVMKNTPGELIIDRQLFVCWQRARHVVEVQIVNGLVPGQLTKALAGEPVGTVITRN
jgi:molybdenum storage protein